MSATEDNYLTVADVAERLQMTPDGVYKLIQRGHLPAIRLSARKLRIPAEGLAAYLDRETIAVTTLSSDARTVDPQALRDEFVRQTGATPEDWLAVWKRDELEDTPENMELAVRAVALRGAAANVPLSHPAVEPWATAAFAAKPRPR
jgi:excisionase family DNA binding protein